MASFLPFLNKLLPTGLALKGLSKLDPRISKFFAGAELAGYGVDEALEFLRSKFENPTEKANENRLMQRAQSGNIRADERENLRNIQGQKSSLIPNAAKLLGGLGAASMGNESTSPASGGLASDILPDQPEAQNVQNQPKDPLELLSGYSPELVQFITQTVKKGQTIKEAVSLAKRDPKLARVISQIEKELGKDLASIVTEMFGGQSFQGAPTGSMGAESMKDVMQQGGGQQQANQGDQQLKAMFDKIMSM